MVGYFIDISPCGKFHLLHSMVESPCDPFLRFHMRTHRRPADLAEASHWWIVEESMMLFFAQFRCFFTTLPKDHAPLCSFSQCKFANSWNSHCGYLLAPTPISHVWQASWVIPFQRGLPLLHSVVGTVLQISLTGDQSQVTLYPADRNLEIHEIPKYLYLQRYSDSSR